MRHRDEGSAEDEARAGVLSHKDEVTDTVTGPVIAVLQTFVSDRQVVIEGYYREGGTFNQATHRKVK